MKIKDVEWNIPSQDRNYYLDLEYQGRIWVDKETYNNYKKDEWSEWKRKQREKRCQIPSDKNKIKRCDKECKKCDYYKNGNNISIDELYELYGYEFVDTSSLIIESIEKEEIKEKLMVEISRLNEIDQKILLLFSENKSEREISKILNIPRTTISYRKQNSFKILKEKLKDYY